LNILLMPVVYYKTALSDKLLGLYICAIRKAAYMTYESSDRGYYGALNLHVAERFSPGFCGLCVITGDILTIKDYSWSARSGARNVFEPVPP